MSGPIIINDKIEIPAADLDYDFSRAGGPGGQHVNTTDTRVRMRFSLSSSGAQLPTWPRRNDAAKYASPSALH